MGYKRAEEILPQDIIEIIQKYVEGESIYIPKRSRQEWGKSTKIRQELTERNSQIQRDFQNGCSISKLSEKYFLTEKSIRRILKNGAVLN